jgi:hypothetical protein
MPARDWIRGFAGATLLLAAACTQAPTPRVVLHPVEAVLQPFLPSPVELLGVSAEGAAGQLHDRLLAGEDPVALEAEIPRTLPAGDAAHLLLAETRLVAGDGAGAFEELQRLPAEVRGRTAIRLMEARAREMAGDLVESYALYRSLAASNEAAAGRAARLEERAVAECRDRIHSAIGRGRVADARRDLERLEAWRPGDLATVQAEREVAVAAGDTTEELAALRSLDADRSLDRDGILRLAQLELDVGDPGRGLSRLQSLAAEWHGDPEVAEALERARFRWRLVHAPQPVQAAAAKPQLTRADLAELLYWLVPGIRADRGGVPRIASDIVGHPAQDEVIRIVNLGVMKVDETLHLFQPDLPVRRTEALAAILRSTGVGAPPPACARSGSGSTAARDAVCQAAAACGLVPDPADCLPGGGVSGREALDWIRKALRLGSDGSGRPTP